MEGSCGHNGQTQECVCISSHVATYSHTYSLRAKKSRKARTRRNRRRMSKQRQNPLHPGPNQLVPKIRLPYAP